MSLVIVLVTGAVLVQSGAPRATGGPPFGTARTVAARTPTATPVDGPAEQTVAIDGVAYPNPFRRDNGDPVTTAAEWEGERRAELLHGVLRSIRILIRPPQ